MLLGIFLYNGTMFYELKNGTLVETKDAQGNFDLTQVLGNKYLEDVDSEKCVIVDTYSNNQMMALFFILSGIALGVLGLVNVPVWTILFMLILPLFLDIPSYLLGEVQNSIVDAAGREDNRAELLSVFNMGVNVTEIFYLFGSSLLVSAGSTACFVILGAFMTVVGIGICLSVKSAWLLSLQEKKNGN